MIAFVCFLNDRSCGFSIRMHHIISICNALFNTTKHYLCLMRFSLTLILFLCVSTVFSQQNAREKQIDSLLAELVKQQAGSPEFASGIFPSYRIQSKGKALFADDNIFFSAIIAMRLMRLEEKIPASSKKNAQTIVENVRSVSKLYENKYGRISYNFWQTKPVKQFPGDEKLSQKTRYHIPDDADDSIILFLVNQKKKEEVDALKKMIEENVPGKKRNIHNTPKQFKTLPAYSTWLGDRMPPEFDFCVMTNVLYVFAEHKLLYKPSDYATISYIRESFADGYLQEKAYRVSPQYKTETACLYHLAFLLSAHEIVGLRELKPDLVKRLHEKLPQARTKGEALLIVSALGYLNEKIPASYQYPADQTPFPFFYANLGSVTPNPFNAMMSKSQSLNYPYECKAWDMMLELEILLNGYQVAGSR